jgi:hypothetical protein
MSTLKSLTAATAPMLAAGAAQAQPPLECATGIVWRSGEYQCAKPALVQTPLKYRSTWDSREWQCTSTECVIEGTTALIMHGTSDIDIMERCRVAPNEIEAILGVIMQRRVAGRPIGRTPFKDAHCRPTYSGFECEYKGVTMELSTR